MRILLVGNGGREHALAAALARSGATSALFCTRPNPGIAALAQPVDVAPDDVPGLVHAAVALAVELVVVGPERPLCLGLADALRARGVAVLGPSQGAAQIEGSKIFARTIMREAGIATARWTAVRGPHDLDAGLAWAAGCAQPPVVKADGLMAGKGVVVANTLDEVREAVTRLLAEGPVLLEERLQGPEVSVIGLSDGERVLALPSARDHKRIFDGDRGPNTGGMGAVSPAPGVSDALVEQVRQQVLVPALAALEARGTPFVGFLYAGVMLTPEGPQILEFNCRLGDPEAQVLLARLGGDVAQLLALAATGRLDVASPVVDARPAACVVVSAAGYPAAPRAGDAIHGLAVPGFDDVAVLHAGTRAGADGEVLTSGGRVLGVTALGADLPHALSRVYARLETLRFEGMHYRRDIGAR